MSEMQSVQAIVRKVISDGKHGPYAVASNQELGSITFALSEAVWPEENYPEPGEVVCLYKLRKIRAGWRSLDARRIRP